MDVYGRAEGRRDTDLPDHVGMCYIHSDSLRDTEGKVEATITSIKHQPIGRLVGELFLRREGGDIGLKFTLIYCFTITLSWVLLLNFDGLIQNFQLINFIIFATWKLFIVPIQNDVIQYKWPMIGKYTD